MNSLIQFSIDFSILWLSLNYNFGNNKLQKSSCVNPTVPGTKSISYVPRLIFNYKFIHNLHVLIAVAI